MTEMELGHVTHYFNRIGVAALAVEHGELHVGDTIHVKGRTSDFIQKVESIEIDRHPVEEAVEGQNVGIKAIDHAREHDCVYKLTA